MGYDMTIVQERDQTEQDAIAAAHAHIATLARPFGIPEGEERDTAQAAWEEAYDALRRADRSYFRLNIWGMSRCCDAMDALGMVTAERAPRWPSPEEFGLDEYPDNPADYEGDERAELEAALTDGGRNFLAAAEAAIGFEPEPVRGIPIGKFDSNDGWLVTPRQIEAALKAWRGQPQQVRERTEAEYQWWPGWVAFLAYAQGRCGFRVY